MGIAEHLGGDEAVGADHDAGASERVACLSDGSPHEAPVSDRPAHVLLEEEDVVRGHIAVHEPERVRGAEPGCGLRERFDERLIGELLAELAQI